jgi:hypothetical protein
MLNGLSGALIIEGDFAGIPEIENANDEVLLLQQIVDETLPLLLPGGSEERRRRAGDFVIHCHILGHEDRGMMQRIAVKPTSEDCDAAHALLDGSRCEAESVCCDECQSANVDMSKPLPAICQTTSTAEPPVTTRVCMEGG